MILSKHSLANANRKKLAILSPKVKLRNRYFKGHMCGSILKYLEDYPTAPLEEVKVACELNCSIGYLCT